MEENNLNNDQEVKTDAIVIPDAPEIGDNTVKNDEVAVIKTPAIQDISVEERPVVEEIPPMSVEQPTEEAKEVTSEVVLSEASPSEAVPTESVVTEESVPLASGEESTASPVIESETVNPVAPVLPEVESAVNNVVEEENKVASNEVSAPSDISAPVTPVEPKKKSPILIILIVIVLLAGIGFAVWKFVLNKDEDKTTTNDNNKQSENSNKSSNSKASAFNGVYSLNGNTLKIYAKSDDEVEYVLKGEENYSSGSLEYSGGILSKDIFDSKITIKNDSSNLVVESTDNSFPGGTYKKEKDYNKEDFYNDAYGSKDYLSSKYNGKYVDGDITVYAYQNKEKSVRVEGGVGTSMFTFTLELDDKNYGKTEIFETSYEITFNENDIKLVITENGNKSTDKTINKEKSLTQEDILKTFEPEFD